MYKIYQIIDHNIEIITSLNEEVYPELVALRRKTTIIRHLYDLMQHMLSYSMPIWPTHNRQYFLFSKKQLSEWNKSNGGGGDPVTWQSHKIFLLHAGLIKTHVVIGKQKDPVLQLIWEKAEQKGYRSETLWSVPLYTPTVLNKAEQIALEYRMYHVNKSHISKNTIARVWGQRIADGLYRNSKHIISYEERHVESCLQRAISEMIEKDGFATLENMFDKGLALCMESGQETEKDYKQIISKLLKQKRLLIDRAGYEYHPIRRCDRSYLIPADHKGYIITKKL